MELDFLLGKKKCFQRQCTAVVEHICLKKRKRKKKIWKSETSDLQQDLLKC